jgi:DNA-binding transcriptional LysR family regulator
MLSRRVKSLLGELRSMTEELNEFRLGTAGRVIIGTLISASAYLLPAAITLLKQRAPRIVVTVREGPTATLFPALATGDLDIVVGRLPEIELPIANAFPLTHVSLFEDMLSVVMGVKHTLDGRAVSLRDLASLPWILPSTESPLRVSVERMFRQAQIPLPLDVVESLSILTNLELLMRAPRIGLMPRAAARQFVRMGLLRTLDIPEAGSFGSVLAACRAVGRDGRDECGKRALAGCQRAVSLPYVGRNQHDHPAGTGCRVLRARRRVEGLFSDERTFSDRHRAGTDDVFSSPWADRIQDSPCGDIGMTTKILALSGFSGRCQPRPCGDGVRDAIRLSAAPKRIDESHPVRPPSS